MVHQLYAIFGRYSPQEWYDSWTTLSVNKNHDTGGVWCQKDAFPPPNIPAALTIDAYPKYDLFELQTVHVFNRRVREVQLPGTAVTCIFKTANWTHEPPFVAREVAVYDRLDHVVESRLAPKLLGYVYEVSPDRVVGFLVERVQGRPAGIEDLAATRAALKQLHRYVLHGDVCRYNILDTDDGIRFIDFEQSVLRPEDDQDGNMQELERKMEVEVGSLEASLADESPRGRPYGI
ncbi:hypothetical protein VTK56DRAFT_948 [Thermocarpiscus australiensis]